MCLDSNDLVIAEGRLADFTEMLDLTACYWGTDRPVIELPRVVLTACHIYELLINDLSQVIDGMEVDTFQDGDAATAAQVKPAVIGADRSAADKGSAANSCPGKGNEPGTGIDYQDAF